MKIIINNIAWQIKFINGHSSDLQRYDGTYTIGMADNRKKTIFLYDKLDGSLLYKVLCHELVHAFCFSYGLRFSIDEEERLADFIATYGRDIFDLTDELIGRMIKQKIS